jgi:hypothetical protein
MTKIKFITVLFLLFSAVTFTSCDTEPLDSAINLDDFNTVPIPANAQFKVDFSGETFNATNTTVYISGNTIVMEATRGNAGEGFGFIIDGSTVGTYQANENLLTYTPSNSEYGYWSLNPENETLNTGSITITSINTTNNTISGTFNFTGYWSDTTVTNILPTVFSNGVFTNLPYVTQSPTNDTFYAKVDGAEFVDTFIQTVISGTGSDELINIDATDANLNSILLVIDSELSAGTYQISNGLVLGLCTFDDVDFESTNGTIVIQSKSATRIKGTFNFEISDGTNTKQVTQGAFDVEY